MPLDADVTPFDNSRTCKEGVSCTHKGYDGYAPMAGYLRQVGWCSGFELRHGKQHCQNGTPAFLESVPARARRATQQPILLRLGAGNDAIENIEAVLAHNEQETGLAAVDFLIKWITARRIRLNGIENADKHALSSEPCPGKRVVLLEVMEMRYWKGYEHHVRRVMRVIEHTIAKYGQALLVAETELEGWRISLKQAPEQIFALNADHGTPEQCHSEFKADMDIERLLSGKFATNTPVLTCAMFAYNILRWLRQNGPMGAEASLSYPSKRRRTGTVMQDFMYLAGRLMQTARRLKLALGRHCPAAAIFQQLYEQLAYG